MSTLGGNKGERERNPNKPKFAPLDINNLYRTSRGESFEPATQKNAAPRKHGMQSLGKVPSARRPPANLPSLKAETSTPTSTQAQTTEQQQSTTNSSSASWADSSSGTAGGGNTANSSNIAPSSGSSNASQVQSTTAVAAANSSNSSSSTWSAVATGNVKEDTHPPPLYQSPQFQNEFPSLGDGGAAQMSTSTTAMSNVNVGSVKTTQNQNSFDSGGNSNVNLRPSTDVASWMQQQQSNSANSGNVRGGGGENGGQASGNFATPTADLNGPPTVMALMPSFLRGSGGGGGSSGIANISSSSGTNHMNLIQKSTSGGGNNSRERERERGNVRDRYNSSYNNDYVNNNMPPRHHRQQHYHHQQQQMQHPQQQQQQQNNNNNNNNNNDERSSSFEPELIQQRPIIREEELERIDSLARDDAWSKHDEIDYNKKLQFSDDEPDDVVKPKEMISMKTDAWRDSEKREMKQQQNGPRSIDPLYVEKMKMVREEEDRKERERKSVAQRKFQELDEKNKQHQPKMMIQDIDEKTSSGIGYTINDADKRDNYNNKSKYINDKYDYDYGRNNQAGSGGAEFKKSSFQSNLPPRFQKQHNIDRRDDDRRPMEKSSASSTSSSYKPLHQQDSKNVPFAQQPAYEQRWIQYNKANQQQGPPPRRNMSSLSQSSSDDNRQSNSGATSNKPTYNRRRHESEEDDYGRYGGKDLKAQSHQKISSSTLSSAQITRSMSDSSEKLSDHNRSEKSTSREYLGSNVCWAEACEQSDKRSTLDVGSVNVSRDRRRVSESSAMSDDQPRTILQRNKPLQEQLQGKTGSKEKELIDDDKKTVLNEGPKNFNAASSINEGDEKKKEKSAEPSLSVEPKKSLEIIPEKEQNANDNKLSDGGKEVINKKESKDDDRHSNKRSPRYDSSSSSRGGSRGSYGSGNYRGNWGNARRGSGHSRGNRYDYSDSEEEEGYEGDWNRKNSSGPRKDLHHRRGVDGFGQNSGQKEGFSPRGEPSRRGRGSSSGGGSFHRNSNSINAPGKSRIDNYGPPSSKSPFGSNDEKSSSEKKVEITKEGNKEKLSDDDRIKQKQKALSDGLMNKSMKDNSNVALQKTSDDPTTAKHSTEQPPSTDLKEKKTPEDDKASNDSKRSSSSYNANRNNNRHDKNSSVSTSAPTSTAGKTIAKPVSSSSSTTTQQQHPPASSPHYTSSSMSKPQDSRGNNGSGNYRGNVNPATSGRPDNNNRMSAAPRFTNKGGNGTNRIGSGGNNSYWEANKNHPESMHDEKMSLMQQLNVSNQSMQQQMSSNMMGKSEQVIKQQQQSMQQASQQQQQAAMLDGASLPKTTLIFENTSLRSGPPQSSNSAAVPNASGGMKRPNVQQSQMQASMGQQQQQKDAVAMGTTTINEMIEQQSKEQSLSSALQNLSFAAGGNAGNHPPTGGQQQKNDMVDMNSFKFSFDTQISQLTDDSSFGQSSASHPSQAKASSLGLVGAKTGGGNNILNTDSLNMKVASCKKVWEEASDHNTVVGSSAEDVMANFVAQQHIQQYNNMSSHSHHTGLSPQSFGYNTGSSNDHSSSLVEQHFVNKVNDNDDGNSYPSPQQHMNAHVMHSQNQQQANLNMKAAEAFATTANVCKVKPTQMHPSGLSPPPQMPQQSQMQHQQAFYPTPNYPNMSTIPSPPVVYNSQATASGLYSYNMDARAQMYGYPTASAGANNNSLSFNAFMQASAAPTHEVYQNLSQYRAAVQPYNQTPQINNPNAVLISSATATSNSMMGSKSNSQQIGAIGSKTSAPPQSGPSAAAAGSYNQQYMNHLYHQQHANSYYPSSTAQQANPYYNTSGSAATGSYGMFGGTSAPHAQQQMPNYGSVGQFPLNSQMLNNLVVNQQYRGGHVVNASNSNGASGSSGSGSNAGASSGANSGGYMNNMKQQHQSQLQDVSSTNFFKNNV